MAVGYQEEENGEEQRGAGEKILPFHISFPSQGSEASQRCVPLLPLSCAVSRLSRNGCRSNSVLHLPLSSRSISFIYHVTEALFFSDIFDF